MNKAELVDAVAKKTSLKKSEIESVIESTFDSILEALKAKEEVRLIGFGTFAVAKSKATTARNPRTGESISVPEKYKAKFRPGKVVTDALESIK